MRPGARLPLDELAPYLLAAPLPPARLDWSAVFGNDQPVEVEVGFGKGMFLVTAGQAHPEVNYLGIEIVRKYQLYAATRVAKRGLGNVRLACADARLFFRDAIVPATVRAVHAYFPDPWWKKRHHKRRLFTPEFAVLCEHVLVPGGRLILATDVADYAVMARELVAAHTRLTPLPPPAENEPAHDLDYLTNFERKFRKEGRPIHRLAWELAQVVSPEGVVG